jgi:mersacidin/lichenicidin family type 2 lantibiotic
MRINKEETMSNKNIIRAWKDPVYRNGLNEAERVALPANPAGSIDISDADLRKVAGGIHLPATYGCNTQSCHTGYLCLTFPRCM